MIMPSNIPELFFRAISLTDYDDSMFVSSAGPHGRRNGHQGVCEVIENINVVPVVEGVGGF